MNWTQHAGGTVVVVLIALLTLSSGVAVAQGDVMTVSSTSNHSGDSGHHSEGTGTASTNHGEEDGHGHGGQGHEGDEHSDSGFGDGWFTIIGGTFLLGAIGTAPLYQYVASRKQDVVVSPVHAVVALLALFTAAVHFYLFVEHGEVEMLFAALGFLGGIALYFTGISRRLLYATGIGFTAIQLILWYTAGMPHFESFGLLDKVAQVILIGALGYLYWQR